MTTTHRVLVAGMGNELLGDDGFGILAAQRCAQADLGADVTVVEAGIAGIGLVQDLMDRYDTVIVLDAVDRDGPPGSLHVLEITVPELSELDVDQRRALLADMHHTVPSKVLILARALGVLPGRSYLVGCQPMSVELGAGLSAPVAAALDAVVDQVRQLAARHHPTHASARAGAA